MELPRLHSNRVNVAAFQRAVWRNGMLTTSSVGQTSHQAETEHTAPTEASDGPERQRLNLTRIEKRTTQLDDDDRLADDGFFDESEDEQADSRRDDEHGGDEFDDLMGEEDISDGSAEDPHVHGSSSRHNARRAPSSSKEKQQQGLLKSLFGATVRDSAQDDYDEELNETDDDGLDATSNDDLMRDEHPEDESLPTKSATRNAPMSSVSTHSCACVGCEFADAMRPVDQFVVEQASRIPKYRLWHIAAQFYERQVQEVVLHNTGQRLPKWTADAIEKHYEFHVIDQTLFRVDALRDLKGMRTMCKERMVVTMPGGAQEVDSSVMKAYMQILSMESREIGLLNGPGLSTANPTTTSSGVNQSKRKRP